MTSQNRYGSRTQGETHGSEQEPVIAGETDPALRELEAQQEAHERDPSVPEPQGGGAVAQDPEEATEVFARSPDAAYGQRESQTDEGEATGPRL
jgi:hypothetical protein